MIGIIVVSHGNLAHELVNAARTIVGEIPAIAAVSIGWSDDMEAAKELLKAVRQAIKATQKMMASENEDVRVFAVDATIKLGNMAMVLIDAVREGRRSKEGNPLARRIRLGR